MPPRTTSTPVPSGTALYCTVLYCTVLYCASKDNLYTCAFRYDWQHWDLHGLQVGKCYRKTSKATSFQDYFDFTKSFAVSADDSWMKTGFYGVSATVDKLGDLVVGNPLLYTQSGYDNVPLKFTVGGIGKIMKESTLWGKKLKLYRAKNVIWALKEEITDYKFAGYSLTTGQSRNLGTTIILGAPKADNFRGKVYVCFPDCFTDHNPRYRELRGTKIGEHFGSAVAACDFTGDGGDDLIVGAPNYAKDRNSFNSGRVHVFTERRSNFYRVR